MEVCLICGAKYENNIGWVEPHYFPCYNHRNNTFYTKTVPDIWSRPDGEAYKED